MSANMPTPVGAEQQRKKRSDVEEWEIEKIGDFLLGLHHQQLISPRTDWLVSKQRLRQEFQSFLNKSENVEMDLRAKFKESSSDVIGSLLYRTGFLLNTPRGSEEFRIKNTSLFRHSNQKLEKYDELRRNEESFVKEHDHDTDCFKVDENAKAHTLVYQGSDLQNRDRAFSLTDDGCYICQENYDTHDAFEEHVEFHSNGSDFESLSILKKTQTQIWTISYKECKSSNFFCFTMETDVNELVIEKIIVIQSRSMYYVLNSRVPYALPSDGKVVFFLDSRLFRTNIEQPIVIVFHEMDKEDTRFIEQHHFMRTEQLPEIVETQNPKRLPNKKTFKPKLNLPQYLPPAEVRAAVDRRDFALEPLYDMSNEFKDYMQNGKQLTRHNIRPVLNVLLQIEDWTIIRGYKDLVQRRVTLRNIGNEYSVFLKTTKNMYIENNLSEYDEVLIIVESSDLDTSKHEELTMDLLVQNTDDLKNQCEKRQGKRKTYFGQVERYANGRVVFTCKKQLPKNKTFTLIFRPGRLLMRYQFRALELLTDLSGDDVERFFFPGVVTPTDFFRLTPECFSGLSLQNKTIYNNLEQLQAVHYIANGPSREAPYIIFGPPGTGKTTTLVESIYQLYFTRNFTKILVMAGSNGACDEIAVRLCRILSEFDDARAIVRIYSKSREEHSNRVDKDLLEASNMYSSQFYPDIDVLHEYRIIVCTLSVSSMLATGKFGKDSKGAPILTHIFVDEAAGSTEAEALMGIINGLSPRASLILSGDHKQLGPILRSDQAGEFGLRVSLLERLLSCCCYNVGDNGDYNHHIQTRLRLNYRSHPEIVKLYSSLYYNNELKAVAAESAVNLSERWHKTPNPKYPIMFHSVFGNSERETNSASLYNEREIHVAIDYVKELMYFGINGEKISQSDIGIISPYKAQYLRIQEQLNLRNWYEIETGSVDTFQGKEKAIIIVSFVRSFTSTLGFLNNPRRFNVTISRAKSLLILIGNPSTLSLNADFKHVIDECQRNNSMVGTAWRKGESKATEEEPTTSSVKKTYKMSALRKELENLGTEKESETQVHLQNQKKNAVNAADRSSNHKKPHEANRHSGQLAAQPKLAHSMKKCINHTSKQKQRQKFVIERTKIIRGDDQEKTEIDKLFEELPKLPQELKKTNAQGASTANISQHRSLGAGQQGLYPFNTDLQGASASNMNLPYNFAQNKSPLNADDGSQAVSSSNMNMSKRQDLSSLPGYAFQSTGTKPYKTGYASQTTTMKPLNSSNGSKTTATSDIKISNDGAASQSIASSSTTASNTVCISQATASSAMKTINNSNNACQATASSGTKFCNAGSGSPSTVFSRTISSNAAYGSQTKISSDPKPSNSGYQSKNPSYYAAMSPSYSSYGLQGTGTSATKSFVSCGSNAAGSSATKVCQPLDAWNSLTTASSGTKSFKSSTQTTAPVKNPCIVASESQDFIRTTQPATRRQQNSFSQPNSVFANLPYNSRGTPEVAYEAFDSQRKKKEPTGPKPASKCTIS